MIIQCEQCKTKFRLDDSRVSDKGVKVRCAKCRHIFTVEKEQPSSELQADFSSLLDQNMEDESAPGNSLLKSAEAQETEPDNSSAAVEADAFSSFNFESNDPFTETDASMPAAEESKSDEAASSVSDDDDNFAGFNFESNDPFAETDVTMPAAEETKPDEAVSSISDDKGFAGFDFENDSFADVPSTTPIAEESNAAAVSTATDDTGFSGFNFESNDPFTDTGGTAPLVEENRSILAADDDKGFIGFDVDSANPFADRYETAPEEPVFSTPVPEPAAEDDFSSFDFTDMPGEVTTAPGIYNQEMAATGTLEEKQDDFFDFNDLKSPDSFSLGNAAEKHDKSSVAAAPVPETPSVSFVKPTQPVAEEKPVFEEKTASSPVTPQEDLPPLSISSRRRQNSLVTAAIAVVGVLAASLAAFYGYSYFAQDKGKSVGDTEKIVIRTVDASFIKNQSVGDLLVITGEAQNNFKKPRAAIQIKVMVYGPDGQIMASKNAYAGNQLTKEQLATLPLDKIETAMANQFGDSLSNLGVLPDKTIPFVIVIPTPPADAKDYGVEPAGSTVATGKQ